MRSMLLRSLVSLACVFWGISIAPQCGYATSITVVMHGKSVSVSLQELSKTSYRTIYNHPILNPDGQMLLFEGVLLSDILRTAGVRTEGVKRLHIFGKDDYIVSVDAQDAFAKYAAMIVPETDQIGLEEEARHKMGSAVPLLIYQHTDGIADNEELNRNYWCWWVKTIVVEDANRDLPVLRVVQKEQVRMIDMAFIGQVQAQGIINTSLQKGVTQQKIFQQGRETEPVIEVPLNEVLHRLGIKQVNRVATVNVNGNTVTLGKSVADLRDIYLGFVPQSGLYRQGFPTVFSKIPDAYHAIKHWPYIVELVVE